MIPAMMKRFTGIAAPSIRTTLSGRNWGCCCGSVPNASSSDECSTRRIPSDATSFASGGELRSGRKDAELRRGRDPHHAEQEALMTTAGAVATLNPNSPFVNPQNA